jgi:hypothetical protein
VSTLSQPADDKGENQMHSELRLLFDERHAQAYERYNTCFDADLWRKATEGKSDAYRKALRDMALLICGSPYKVANHRAWSEPAMKYLRGFM